MTIILVVRVTLSPACDLLLREVEQLFVLARQKGCLFQAEGLKALSKSTVMVREA